MSLDIEKFSSRYQVRPLTEADLPALLKLCRGNPLYYRHMGLEPTTENLAESLAALPPGKGLEDKYFLGFWEGGKLVALLDLIAAYPDGETAFIGWFMVDAACQGRGTGTELITELLEALGAAGFRRVRLAYVKTNPQSRRFWEKNGFLPTGTETAGETYTAVVMERTVG